MYSPKKDGEMFGDIFLVQIQLILLKFWIKFTKLFPFLIVQVSECGDL
jgi:hypothetical protein